MEENKKRPLSEEELEQVAGGAPYQGYSNGKPGWRCRYCDEFFSTLKEAIDHEATCSQKDKGYNAQNSLKPIIL